MGGVYGWPVIRFPWCNSDLKRTAIRMATSAGSLVHKQTQGAGFTDGRTPSGDGARDSSTITFSALRRTGRVKNTVQYLGIAADEPERISRHTKPGYMMPLLEIGWDEAYCRKWCEENGLLSPIYTTASRGGCWFCHNQGVDQLRLLRRNYPQYWALMLKWDKDSRSPSRRTATRYMTLRHDSRQKMQG